MSCLTFFVEKVLGAPHCCRFEKGKSLFISDCAFSLLSLSLALSLSLSLSCSFSALPPCLSSQQRNERANDGSVLEEAERFLLGGVVADGQRRGGTGRLCRGTGTAGGRDPARAGEKGGRKIAREGRCLWAASEARKEGREGTSEIERIQQKASKPKGKKNLNLFLKPTKNPEKACARYAAAELRGPAPPGALYNHAVALTDFSRIPPSGGSSGDGGGGSDPSAAPPAAAAAAAQEVERTRKARLRAAAAKYHQAIVEESSSLSSPSSAAAAPESPSSHAGTSSSGGGGGGSGSSSPQALNNLGLVLQELSALEPPGSRARAALAAAAAARFRAAARGRPDFERAVYNLGTVLYASAPPAAAAAGAPPSSSSSAPPTPSSTPASTAAAAAASSQQRQQQQQARAEALADAAQCVALAAALAPAAPVYARSLALVQPFLPLPRLRAGWLLVPEPLPLGSSSSQQQQQQQPRGSLAAAPAARPFFLPGSVTVVGGKAATPASIFPSSRERFVARWCVIDAEALRATPPPAGAPAAPRGWEDENGNSAGHQHDGGHGGGGGSSGNNSYSSVSAAAHQQHSSQHHVHHAARPMRIPLAEILSATPAADASLPAPAGAGLHLRFASLSSSPRQPSHSSAPPAGFFVVAPSQAAAEAWADALCVAGHVARRSSPTRPGGGGGGGGGAALARVLAPAVGTVAGAGAGPLAPRRPSSSGLAR